MVDAPALIDFVERFIASVSDDHRVGAELSSWVNGEIKKGNVDELTKVFPRLVLPGLDYTTANSLHRSLKQLRQKVRLHDRAPRIAVLGSFTTHPLVSLLDFYLSGERVRAEIYEADYGTFRQEFLDPTSGLYCFRPDFIIVATNWRDLAHRPELTDTPADVRGKVNAELADWVALWRTAHERLRCQIIQNNFDAPPWRTLGNLEMRHPGGFARFVALINQALEEVAPAFVTIHDVDHLAAACGRWDWGDERFYYQAKLPCSPEHLVDYAHSLASLITAQLGLGKKCLVLDLDNTLWGGVIGDDGCGGIRLGQGSLEGEAFQAFQHYVRGLRRRGVILAVCSKNTDAIAREVFEKHPEMVLGLDDISCFVANWDDKATNLARIARELNIGLNSLVFVDDNPAERSIVRRLCHEVAVPEMPADPTYFVRALDRHRFFQALTVSTEDLQRTEFYRADASRQMLASSVDDLNSFLKSLRLIARVEPIGAASLERSVQLINRSNQYNLTTRRRSNGDVMSMLTNPNWITRTVSLQDRFGDNGLICVVLAMAEADALVIDTWVMSCRVLKRGVEQFLLNHLVACARERGLTRVLGEYIPTPKNALVRDHYGGLGFCQVGDDSGHTRWELLLNHDWQTLPHFIQEAPLDGLRSL